MINNSYFNSDQTGTFANIPSTPLTKSSQSKACIVGIPFDCGTHPFRVGSREGPWAIRQQSRFLRQYDTQLLDATEDPMRILSAVDVGDVACFPGDIERSYPQIEAAIDAVLASGATPITMGGDGAVTLPQLRAASRHHPGMVVLHIDAHTDAYDMAGYNTSTTFTRAAEEKLLDTTRSFHVGLRGVASNSKVIEFGNSLGYNLVPLSKYISDEGLHIKNIKETIGDRPIYLCFDMDVFDPSCAPGVCNPEWGGMSAREGLSLLNALRGMNFVAFDVNTTSPAQDIQGMTAHLAATVVWEFCELAAASIGAKSMG